jgi:ribosomal protein S18 acetylase RimI-like enzyme
MNIRKAISKDIKGIVDVHCSAFKGFFLTELGSNFLQLYYSSYFREPSAVLLVAEENGAIVGFSSATSLSAGFNTRLVKKTFLRYALRGCMIALTKPKALVNLVKNWSHRDPSVVDNGDYAELMSIAVLPNTQGGGIGKLLIQETEKVVKTHDASKFSLTTDYYNNDSTIAFYKKCSYEVMYEFTAYPNRKMLRMIKVLN